LAMVGAISSVFRFFWGWLSDRIGREITYTMGISCGFLGVSSLLLFEAFRSPLLIYSFFVFFGMGWGVTAPMFMAVSADLFQGRIYGLIYGFVEASVGIGAAFGSWVAGFIFDRAQSYQMAFGLVIVCMLLSCIFIWLAAPRRFRYFN
jgi:MFS family permease